MGFSKKAKDQYLLCSSGGAAPYHQAHLAQPAFVLTTPLIVLL